MLLFIICNFFEKNELFSLTYLQQFLFLALLDISISPDRTYNFTIVSSFIRLFICLFVRSFVCLLVKSFSQNWLISFSLIISQFFLLLFIICNFFVKGIVFFDFLKAIFFLAFLDMLISSDRS